MTALYNCILFDVDGTLLDFDAAEREAISATLEKFGLPAEGGAAERFSAINAELWRMLERGEVKKDRLVVLRFKRLLDELSVSGDPVRMNSEFLTRLSGAAPVLPGAAEMLEELAEYATLAVASNAVHAVQLQRLEKSGLAKYFDAVFTSEKLGATKPSARFFERALEALGVRNKARVLVAGDSLAADVKGAAAAGLHSCWCNFRGEQAVQGAAPTYTVRDFTQLKLVAMGEEALKFAAAREKRHTV